MGNDGQFVQWMMKSMDDEVKNDSIYEENKCAPTLVLQFSRSLMSDSLHPHGLQHSRPPCPSPTPRVYPNSCPLSS